MKKNDGGPAFPRASNNLVDARQDGITLRQWYAGQALIGALMDFAILRRTTSQMREKTTAQHLASVAFEIADAMIQYETNDEEENT